MPTIYQYFGIMFFFYPGDHYPVHVHARYGKEETVYELIFKNGKIIDVVQRRTTMSKKNPLSASPAKQAKEFIFARKEQIYKKWKESIIEKKKVKCEIITKKV